MPRFDFVCPTPECQLRRADVYIATANAATPRVVCPSCGAMMVKQPAAPNFVVTGFNANNGYSK